MNVEPLEEKYRSFGWEVRRIDGHDMEQVVEALEEAKRISGKPLVILADTVKGKGVSFMENMAGWHGKTPNHEELGKAWLNSGSPIRFRCSNCWRKRKPIRRDRSQAGQQDAGVHRDYWWNAREHESEDGADAQGFRPVAGRTMAATSAWCAWGWTFRVRSRSATSTQGSRSARIAGSAWASPSNPQPRPRRDWRKGREASGVRHVRHVRGRTQSRPDSHLDLLRQFQRDDRGRAWRRFGWSGRGDPPGARRSVCDVRSSEHVGRRALRLQSRRARQPAICCSSTRGRNTSGSRARPLRWSPTSRHLLCSARPT